ncbi:MAG: diphthamide synthesis protein [Candidatus Woesearchaeota archaeon]
MKIIHAEVRYTGKIVLPKEVLDELPVDFGLFTTVQFIHQLEEIQKQLEDAGKKPVLSETRHTQYLGQLYGCNVDEFDVPAFFYVGDGLFHPHALMLKNNKPVYYYNPFNNAHGIVDKAHVEKMKKQRQAAMSAFLMAKNVGVLVTTKPGQTRIRNALQLKEKYPDKNFYFLTDNTFNLQSLEDFPFCEVFVNTACPRIAYEDTVKIPRPIVDLDELGLSSFSSVKGRSSENATR